MKEIYSILVSTVYIFGHSEFVQNQNGGLSNFPQVGKNIYGWWIYLGLVDIFRVGGYI
jgi:hypothetical protein